MNLKEKYKQMSDVSGIENFILRDLFYKFINSFKQKFRQC